MNFILTVHHYISFVLLFVMAFTIFYVFFKKLRALSEIRKLTFVMISLLHFQLILGFLLVSRYVFLLWHMNLSIKEIMASTYIRYQIIEHPVIMLIAIMLATIAHILLKRNAYNKGIFLLLIAFICMLSCLPFKKLLT